MITGLSTTLSPKCFRSLVRFALLTLRLVIRFFRYASEYYPVTYTTPGVGKTVPLEHLIEKYSQLRWDPAVTKEDPAVQRLKQGILQGSRAALASAITLVESKHPTKRAQGNILLKVCLLFILFDSNLKEILKLEHKKYADVGREAMIFRIGISGSPGVGKSSFIEALGKELTERRNMKTAVLTIDPSSAITGGSILGDLTRMQELSRNPKAYIRQSPSSGMSFSYRLDSRRGA